MAQNDIADRLAARLGTVLGEDAQVSDLRRLTAGANSETWSFTCRRGAESQRLIATSARRHARTTGDEP
jgi:tRNA U55 pseudouridine synthase TruB